MKTNLNLQHYVILGLILVTLDGYTAQILHKYHLELKTQNRKKRITIRNTFETRENSF
jgi:hypothetical protein